MPITLDWPGFKVREFRWGLQTLSVSHASPFNNQSQATELPGARWMATLTVEAAIANTIRDERARLEAFLMRIGGPHNRIAMWHLRRPRPIGTMRGSPTLASSAAQMATTLTIQTTVGATLLAGDLFGIGSQLFMNSSDATANGSGVMTVIPTTPTRSAISSGTAVVWDRPKANFILTAPPQVPYGLYIAPALSIDLIENF